METVNKEKYRILSIDILRGLVMVIMALDHVRDYFHNDAMLHDPMNVNTTTPFLYFTRWITHYCAPIFVFLSGISAYLSSLRKTKKEASIFLIKRGLFLILMEVTIVTLGWSFNPAYNMMVFQVIWAIGFSMLVLGFLSLLPQLAQVFIALILVFGHNILDTYEQNYEGKMGFIWDALHHGGFNFYPYVEGHGILVVYPVIPWIGIMLLGYVFGTLFEKEFDAQLRKRFLFLAGSFGIIMFFGLRFYNEYGNPEQWKDYGNFKQNLMAFLDVSKYPPSLMYTGMTIGPALIFLAFTENIKNKISEFFMVFGRVPFFYYVLHIYLIHTLCVILFYISGYGADDISGPRTMFYFRPAEMGFGLLGVYLVWFFVIFVLYFPSKWYNKYRAGKSHWIFKYI